MDSIFRFLFKKGDIVKAESPFYETYYGVIPYGVDGEEEEIRKKNRSMYRSLDIYNESSRHFGYTDDTNILHLSLCGEDELPDGQKILKTVQDIRKGKKDFFTLLCNDGEIYNC